MEERLGPAMRPPRLRWPRCGSDPTALETLGKRPALARATSAPAQPGGAAVPPGGAAAGRARWSGTTLSSARNAFARPARWAMRVTTCSRGLKGNTFDTSRLRRALGQHLGGVQVAHGAVVLGQVLLDRAGGEQLVVHALDQAALVLVGDAPGDSLNGACATAASVAAASETSGAWALDSSMARPSTAA